MRLYYEKSVHSNWSRHSTPGHINVINEGAKYGRVIVGLLSDEAIASYKRLPIYPYEAREEILVI